MFCPNVISLFLFVDHGGELDDMPETPGGGPSDFAPALPASPSSACAAWLRFRVGAACET